MMNVWVTFFYANTSKAKEFYIREFISVFIPRFSKNSTILRGITFRPTVGLSIVLG